ncbi:MAG: hypothetical protein QNJ69_02325 [Gammaproteobacteria bacterium]|nr:hypothetical protein [Gammaproteobacteria bacterium]
MLDIIFSLKFLWIAMVIILLSIALAFACAKLHQQLEGIALGDWLFDHVYCPISKVLLLILMAFLLFPLILPSSDYPGLLALFQQPDFLINMINILFVSSLLLSFLPVLSHPALAMPLLGCIAFGIFYLHQVVLPQAIDISWVPGLSASVKLIALVIGCYLLCRWLNLQISQWVDDRFLVTGSIRLVSDINYLIFQTPVVLAYGHSLNLQLGQAL